VKVTWSFNYLVTGPCEKRCELSHRAFWAHQNLLRSIDCGQKSSEESCEESRHESSQGSEEGREESRPEESGPEESNEEDGPEVRLLLQVALHPAKRLRLPQRIRRERAADGQEAGGSKCLQSNDLRKYIPYRYPMID
jgi:hypothetical protein